MAAPVRTLEAEKAAAILQAALKGHRGELTIADAAAKGGLALREAELALHHLSSAYRGTLSATESGELLFRFPYGFSLPITKRPGFIRFLQRAKSAVLGVGKLVLRAWISIVLIGYVGVFLAILLGFMFSGRGEGRSSNVGGLFFVLLRVISEALFWTFHPFSPFSHSTWGSRQQSGRMGREREKKVPFYERVNRFVFGPGETKLDARELERRILAQMRASRGRVGIGDVMRVTGLPREEADPMMARLMLDYDGEVDVSEDGGIFYSFPAIRRTANETAFDPPPPPPAWSEKAKAPAITGNEGGSNVLISALNGFNLVMSLIALQANITIDRLAYWWQTRDALVPVLPLPYDGVPLVLGLIPFVFSALIFALPMYRWATQASREKQAKAENARKAVLKTVLEARGGVAVDDVKKAWTDATGAEPDDRELSRHIAALGGDVDIEASERGERAQYRFRDLEAEVAALRKEREEASASEKEVGAVVFRA